MKTGLIMEGGTIGVSAGAAFGCNYKSRQSGRVIRPAEALPIGRTEKGPKKLRLVYEIGRQTAQARIGEIQQFLTGK